MESIKKSLIIIAIDILIFALLYTFLPFERNANIGICILIFVGILWITEATHTAITALCVPFLAVIFGLENTSSALKTFADPVIFLFFGGFAIASALHIQALDRFIANYLIYLAKGKMG